MGSRKNRHWRVARRGAAAGAVAGSLNSSGYLIIGIDYRRYLAHRLAFLWVEGRWPDGIDHCNLDRKDNRWCNLREATGTGSVMERFEQAFIPEPNSGCWLRMGSPSSSGYGEIKIKGHRIQAHRLSWEIHYGPIPVGMNVCHRCDVRQCVNPEHLFIGSHLDNAKDRA
jgi:HNH endonuclease